MLTKVSTGTTQAMEGTWTLLKVLEHTSSGCLIVPCDVHSSLNDLTVQLTLGPMGRDRLM